MNASGASGHASLRSLIRVRPLRVEALEDAFGYGFWDHLDDTLSEYCQSKRKDAATVLERFSALEERAFERDWMALPAYRLIDHLTVEHREFRERDLSGCIPIPYCIPSNPRSTSSWRLCTPMTRKSARTPISNRPFCSPRPG